MGMRSVIDAVMAILFWLLAGGATVEVYQFFKTESLTKIQQGQPSLEKFTQKMSNSKLDF